MVFYIMRAPLNGVFNNARTIQTSYVTALRLLNLPSMRPCACPGEDEVRGAGRSAAAAGPERRRSDRRLHPPLPEGAPELPRARAQVGLWTKP